MNCELGAKYRGMLDLSLCSLGRVSLLNFPLLACIPMYILLRVSPTPESIVAINRFIQR